MQPNRSIGSWASGHDAPYLLLVLLGVLALGCKESSDGSGGGGDPVDPFADYEVPDDVFAQPTAEGDFVEYNGGWFARDQVLVALDPASAAADLAAVTAALDAEVVGQIPDIGLYQLAVDAPDAAAVRTAADAARALDEVVVALPNARGEYAESPAHCLEETDNQQLDGDHRCAFDEVEHYASHVLMAEIQGSVPLSSVRVAVIDTGLALETNQFNNVPVLNLVSPDVSPIDPVGHGTTVAGVIAADDGDGGTGGLASSLIWNNLHLLVGESGIGYMDSQLALRLAAEEGLARVVNFSWGYAYFDPAFADDAAAANELFGMRFNANPETLFVIAAGNESTELMESNYSPAGQRYPNAWTVGATAACQPDQPWYSGPLDGSNWGDRVDLAAPGEDVPVLNYYPDDGVDNPGGDPTYFDGTSFSAPIVTSLVAVLLSIDPNLSIAELRDYVIDQGAPAHASIGGKSPRFTHAIAQLLIDENAPDDVLRFVDGDETEGEADAAPLIVDRICGGAHLTVQDIGSWSFSQLEDGGGSGLYDGLFMLGFGDPGVTNWVTQLMSQPFKLDQAFAIPEPAEVLFSHGDFYGTGFSGHLVLTDCTVTERNKVGGNVPVVIEVEGKAEGVLEVLDIDTGLTTMNNFEATFVLPAGVFTGDTVNEAIELQCVGGTDYEG